MHRRSYVPQRRRLTMTLIFAALSACSGGDGDGMGPDPDPVVTVTPSAVSMIVGDTASIAASVTGSTATPTFTSSDVSVVSVDGSGRLLAAGEGTATVTAAVGSASASAAITVGAAEPTLEITALTQDGQPVDPEDVSGTVEVTVAYDGFPNTASGTLELTLDDVVVGSTPFPGSAAARAAVGGGGGAAVSRRGGVVRTEMTTNAVSIVNADELTPRNPDGVAELLARVPGVAVSDARSVNLDNGNQVYLRGLGFDRTVTIDGTTWNGGVVSARVDVLTRDARTPTAVSVELEGIGTQTFPTVFGNATTVNGNRWDVTYSLSATAGIESPMTFSYADVTYDDLTTERLQIYGGPTILADSPLPTFNLDRVAGSPTVGGFTLQEPWFGDSVDETAALGRLGVVLGGDAPTYSDGGVGGLTAELHWGTNYASLQRFTSTNALSETSGLSNVFQIRWRDALNNERTEEVRDAGGQPVKWGLDGTIPTLARITGAGYLGRRNNDPSGLTFGWSGTDTGSGLSGQIYGRLVRRGPGIGDAGECVVGGGSTCDFTALSISGRAWDVLALKADVGEYLAEVRESDKAGYLSDPLGVRYTLGGASPTIINFSAPSAVTGGASTTWGADVSDDLEVRQVQWSLKYGGWDYRIGKTLTLGAAYDTDFTTSASVSESLRTIASVETSDAGGVPSGTIYGLTALEFGVRDASGQSATESQSVEGNVTGISLTTRYGFISDRLHITGPSTIVVNKDGTPNPQSTGSFAVEAWAQNISTFDLTVGLALAGTDWLGQKVLYTLDDVLTPTVQDNGGWYQIFYNKDIDFAAIENLHKMKISGYAAIGWTPSGNALLSNIRSLDVSLVR